MKFQLTQALRIKRSGHTGECTARAEYSHSVPCYQIAFVDAQGNAHKEWFDEPELEAVES